MKRPTDTLDSRFSTKILDQFDIPGTKINSACIGIGRIEIGNNSGSDARVGWGYSFYRPSILISDLDNSTLASKIIQDLTYTSKIAGSEGNSISIKYQTGGTAGAETVDVTDHAIVVHMDATAVTGSTANQIKAAIEADTDANPLVSITVSGTGSTVQAAQSTTLLTGGSDDAITPLNDLLDSDGSVEITTSLVIQTDTPFNSVQLNITDTASAILEQRYWNGSEFVTFTGTEFDAMDISSSGVQFNTFVPPADWAPLQLTDSPVTDSGMTQGKYVWIIDISGSLSISSIDIVKLINYVEVVADGNTLVDTYSAGKKLPPGCKVVPYISNDDADNSIIFEYYQG